MGKVGLLKPTGRTEGGFRLYTHDDLARLMLIRRMKPLGFSLGGDDRTSSHRRHAWRHRIG